MLRKLPYALPLLFLAMSGCGPASSESQPLRLPSVSAAPVAAPQAPASSAPGLTFLTDYRSAVAQARADGKPLLLFFGARWCAHTQRMAAELPVDPQVARLAADFVCVRIDVDAAPKLCEEYRVRAYPTLILAAPGGVVLQRLTGLQSSPAVAQEMSAALTAVAERFPVGATTLQR